MMFPDMQREHWLLVAPNEHARDLVCKPTESIEQVLHEPPVDRWRKKLTTTKRHMPQTHGEVVVTQG